LGVAVPLQAMSPAAAITGNAPSAELAGGGDAIVDGAAPAVTVCERGEASVVAQRPTSAPTTPIAITPPTSHAVRAVNSSHPHFRFEDGAR
jgi:hypothetical protein